MRASSPSRTEKAAQVTSKDRQDKMKAMKIIAMIEIQSRGLNRILNRRSPFVGERFEKVANGSLSSINVYSFGWL
jgi:hypothetical protein